MEVRPFRAEDFMLLQPQPAQRHVVAHVTPEYLKSLEGERSVTGWVGDKPVWCCGYHPIYPTRAAVWTFISADAGAHFTAIHRVAKHYVDTLPFARLETEVDYEFEEGHRWAQMVGFTREIWRMRGARIDGGDCSLYAKVK